MVANGSLAGVGSQMGLFGNLEDGFEGINPHFWAKKRVLDGFERVCFSSFPSSPDVSAEREKAKHDFPAALRM
jgi:hypothetical protein